MKIKAPPNTVKIHSFFKPGASSSQPTKIVDEADVQVTNHGPSDTHDPDMPDTSNWELPPDK